MDESNPIGNIIQAFKALFPRYSNAAYKRIILSKLRGIFNSYSASTIFTYFCQHGAATAWVLQCHLDICETTTYRALKPLRELGFIVPALKVSKVKRSKGGPRPTVWALEGASPQEVADALRLHYRLLPTGKKEPRR